MFKDYSKKQFEALASVLNMGQECLDEDLMPSRAQVLGDLNAIIDSLYGIDNDLPGPRVLENMSFKIDSGKDILEQLAHIYRDSVLYFNLNDSQLDDDDKEMAIQFQRASEHLANLAAISFDEVFRNDGYDYSVQQIICEELDEAHGYHVRNNACNLAVALEKIRMDCFEELLNWETIYHIFAKVSGIELDSSAQLEFTGDERPGLFGDE